MPKAATPRRTAFHRLAEVPVPQRVPAEQLLPVQTLPPDDLAPELRNLWYRKDGPYRALLAFKDHPNFQSGLVSFFRRRHGELEQLVK